MGLNPVSSLRVTSTEPALKKLDSNGDNVIDRKDFPGLSDEQFQAAMLVAGTMAQEIEDKAPEGLDLSDKRVVFSALDMSKKDAAALAKSVGAEVKKSFSKNCDILVVGDADRTTKDEKAFRMNAAGEADIRIMSESAFTMLVSQNGAKVVTIGSYGAPYTQLGSEVYNETTNEYDIVHANFSDALLKKIHGHVSEEARFYFEMALDDPTPENIAAYAEDIELRWYELDEDSNEVVFTWVSGSWNCGFEAHVDLTTGELDYVESRD